MPSPIWERDKPTHRLIIFIWEQVILSLSQPTDPILVRPLQPMLIISQTDCTATPKHAYPIRIVTLRNWQNQFRVVQPLQSMLQNGTVLLFQNIFERLFGSPTCYEIQNKCPL